MIRFAALTDLTPTERQALRQLAGPATEHPRGAIIRAEGGEPALHFLHDGWCVASSTLADGVRQHFEIHLPGDVMGAPSLPLRSSAATLSALTEVSVSRISLQALGRIFVDHPRLGALLFLTANEERVVLMDRLTSIGRRSAIRRLAALLLHLDERLSQLDPDQLNKIDLPLTQEQIGDFLGLTSVHVNRTFRALETEMMIRRRGRTVEILSRERMRRMAGIPKRSIERNLSWLPEPR